MEERDETCHQTQLQEHKPECEAGCHSPRGVCVAQPLLPSSLCAVWWWLSVSDFEFVHPHPPQHATCLLFLVASLFSVFFLPQSVLLSQVKVIAPILAFSASCPRDSASSPLHYQWASLRYTTPINIFFPCLLCCDFFCDLNFPAVFSMELCFQPCVCNNEPRLP